MDIKKLISEMTLEEKAGLCSGLNFWETKPIPRLNVPSIMMTDGPHGLRKQTGDVDHLGVAASVPSTCFPTAALTGCSFDREMLCEMGELIADEAIAEGVSVVLGPGVNIKRSPLCGRNFEYFSEDPYIAGEMAAAFIKGVQSKGVGTSVKHYAANNQETRRFSTNAVVDERTLNEIYFPAFKKAVEEAKAYTVMCSYNRVNGTYACENKYLLTETLRDKWGFDGIVVSDWGAVNDRVMCLEAGLELEMPGGKDINDKKITRAVKNGSLSEEVLNTAVERHLTLLSRVSPGRERVPFDAEKHNAFARKIAAESMVLLKNNGILPLKNTAKIAFIGEFADKPRYQGTGSSGINPIKMTSALDAAKDFCEAAYYQGYESEKSGAVNEKLMAEAVAGAKSADICVLFVGLPTSFESEGFDRDHMKMPEGQNALIEAVAKANPNTVVVLHNGAPVEMPWIDSAQAILEAYLGGQNVGGAVCDILFGKVNPSGKLTESFPKKLSDNPSHLYYIGEMDECVYREGIFVGYRYYDAKEMETLFPFGHGLSYTTFEYSNLKLSSTEISDTDTLTVNVDVKNTGNVAGKNIVQLYVGAKNIDDRLNRAPKELKGFEAVRLQPGETKTVTITLDKSAFAYYNTQIKDWHVMSGGYSIMIAHSSAEIALTADVAVKAAPVPFRADVNTPLRDIRRMAGGEQFIQGFFEKAKEGAFSSFAENISGAEPGSLGYMFLKMVPEMNMRSFANMGASQTTVEEMQALLDEHVNKYNT